MIDKIKRARECAAHEREMANDPNNCKALDALYDLRLERAAMFDELADLLEAQEKAEPVGEIIQYPHANFTIPTVSAELPVGTKLYAHPPTTPTGVAQAPVVDERSEFVSRIKGTKFYRPVGNDYQVAGEECAWFGWQLRAKLGQATDKACSAVVPEAKEPPKESDYEWRHEFLQESWFRAGWNDCRAAMQANCDAILKGEK